MAEPDHEEFAKKLIPLVEGLRLYHRHEVVGMDHVPTSGPALIVSNHSLATYDLVLLMAAIYYETSRLPRPLTDRLFFKIPAIGQLVNLLGGREGSHANARRLLRNGELVTVAPGGMREALRPSTQRYQIRWDRRKGFVRLAIRTGSPVILAACPKADDLYDVYPSHVTNWAYRRFKVPVFLARGLGLSPLPRPVQLTHFLSEPMHPPKSTDDPDEFERRVRQFHKKLVKRMHKLIADGIHYRPQEKQLPPQEDPESSSGS